MKYIINFLTLIFLAFLIGFTFLYISIKDDADKIINYKPNISTQIYDRNGKLIANVFDEKYRLYAEFNKIPSKVIEALVAIEDTDYFEHFGINPDAIFRAIIKDIKAMALVEGASTITQQLIKNIALTREKTLSRKIKEVALALKVENDLSKEQILERYLNEVYYGHGYYGIKTAALGYFKKDLSALSLKEAAMLVGLPKAPSSYDPTKNLNLSLSRANNVIYRMHSLGWISEAEYIKATKEQPLIYDESLTQNKAPYIVDQVLRETNELIKDFKTGGYQVHLAVDLRLQELAKIALKKGYDELNEFISQDKNKLYDINASEEPNGLNGAIVVTDSKNGDILALVGGVDYEKSAFNRAVQSRRQVGSSIKPFIYLNAIDLGYSPMSLIPDISRVYEDKINNKTWKPKNYGNSFNGLVTLKDALSKSRNLATINLVNEIGLDVMHTKLKEMGFSDVPLDLSISLGSFGVSPLQYAYFYSAFSNDGEMVKPRLINYIINRKNEELRFEIEKNRLTSPEQNFLMVDMMRSVVENGSGRRAKMDEIEVAGKTGTSNENVDLWFCGYTPEIEILIWFGRDDNRPIGKHLTGARIASVFKDFMDEYLKIYPQSQREFKKPQGVFERIVDNKKVYFTNTSPLPKASNDLQNADGLIF